jgi:hypothetical protein
MLFKVSASDVSSARLSGADADGSTVITSGAPALAVGLAAAWDAPAGDGCAESFARVSASGGLPGDEDPFIGESDSADGASSAVTDSWLGILVGELFLSDGFDMRNLAANEPAAQPLVS